ncbi:MAG: YtxH domain-containing protein [Armatimonadota bacterium]
MRTENRNLVIGTIIGVVIGGAAAIMLAPSPGTETRQRLRQASGRTREKAMGLTAKGREYLESKKAQIREAIESGRRAAEEKLEELEYQVQSSSKTGAT